MLGETSGAKRFIENASEALAKEPQRKTLQAATGRSSAARLKAAEERPDWEELRRKARAIKTEAISYLARYLEQLEERVTEHGGIVFWARDAAEASAYIVDLCKRKEVKTAVKGKSMTSEEINLNHVLEAAGVTPVETDLGEYIVQLANETPSHIILPAIHKSRQDVSELFTKELGVERTDQVEQLAAVARKVLRRRFLEADMGITGANFGIAETGTIVLVENEGNIRFSTSAPKIHVAIMGIEKVLPRFADLSTFLRLLPRSGTGQRLTSYVNFINGPKKPGDDDGPTEFHLVLLDNGRTKILADPEARESLFCIRCGACLNVCPIYTRVGGHSYGWVYPGPIGAMITPQYLGLRQAPDLPFASSLCGSCKDACPVKINIPNVLLHLRHQVIEKTRRSSLMVKLAAWMIRSPWRYRVAMRLFRWFRKIVPWVPGWTRTRDFPAQASKSLRKILADESR
jgi:L-lactate dehydrogenase complex protein LldF